jgi:hypothetical protein
MSKKPVDMKLGLGGIAMGIVYWLIPKNPATIIISLIVIFALLIHPIWNLRWIEERTRRRILAILLFITILIILGIVSWPRSEKQKEIKPTILQLNLPPLAILPQAIKSDVELIEIDADREKSELIVTFRNNNAFDLSPDATAWLGVFHVHVYTHVVASPEKNWIEWIKSENKQSIKSGKTAPFVFRLPLKDSMHVVALVEDKELRKGIFLDEMGIKYTWNWWRPSETASWQNLRHRVAESHGMQLLLDELNDCLNEHSIKQNYNVCLESKK